MKVIANSKINLFLDIVKKRSDGYHNIETIFQEIDFYDTIEINIKKNSKGFKLDCNLKELATEDNLLSIAYNKLLPFIEEPIEVDVYLDKLVPMGAGLGGGSSDCANFMNALIDLAKINISEEELFKIGSKLGADVPFFFKGGTSIGRGIGDELEKLSSRVSLNLLIVNPGIHVSTKDAYEGCVIGGSEKGIEEIVNGIHSGDIEKIAKTLYNGFETSVFKKFPEIKQCRDDIKKMGAIGSLMSGSGSTCFGIFETEALALQAAEDFKKKKYFSKVTKSITR